MIKKISVILFGTLFSLNLYGNEIASYSALKYKMDISKQNPKIQETISKEYANIKKLAKNLDVTVMKNDTDVEVAKNIAIVDIWTNKFLQIYTPTEELTDLYKQEKAKEQLQNMN
ncbi:MAG: hypothetical protein R2837_10875 [Aliarcobacter sp.]